MAVYNTKLCLASVFLLLGLLLAFDLKVTYIIIILLSFS